MELWWQIIGVVAAIAMVVPVLIMQYRSGHPIRGIAATGLQGACALAAVNVTGMYTGVSLGLNWLTGCVGLVFGLPGIAGLLFLNVLFT